MNELMLANGITFYFAEGALAAELKKQIDKNAQEIGKIEGELPAIKNKVLDLEKQGRMRSPEHEEAEQRVMVLEHVRENLSHKNEFLSFYAAHLSPGTHVLMLNDARELGFVGHEYGTGMIGHAEKAMLTRKRGY